MPDSFSHSVRLDTSPSEAWKQLHEADTWAGIGGIDEITDATHNESGELTGFTFVVSASGRRVEGTAATKQTRENELFVLEIASSELVGEVNVRLAANDASGTKLRVVLDMRAKGLLANMFYPIIAQTVGKNLPAQVEKFGRRLSR